MRPLRRAGAVIFDCDSTLSTIEGIEVLAREHASEIGRLTEAAMRGEVPLEDVYGRRLDLVRPTRSDLVALGATYVDSLVPDAREVVAGLRASGIVVRVLSGGLRPAVVHVAAALGIADADVAAVDVVLGADGAWCGFDAASPLARAHGKAAVAGRWRAELCPPVMLVGDGATDLEAAAVVDTFIAYAGVADRPHVTAAADAVVRSRSLAPVLALARAGVPPDDPTHRATFERGLSLLDDETRERITRERDDER